MDKPSISELEELRAKMTPGGWWINNIDGEIYTGVGEHAEVVGAVIMADVNIRGALAAVNAMPALLALAKAAKVWRDAIVDDSDYKAQDAACNALLSAAEAVRP